VVQFPGQAGVTKGFGGEGGARTEALRFCAGFVDNLLEWSRLLMLGDLGDFENPIFGDP